MPGFKTFTNGSVLTDTDLNDYLMRQAVINCTSGTRPASVFTGMTIYETDTQRYATWQTTGATWEYFAGKRVTSYVPALTASTTSPTLGSASVSTSWYAYTPGPCITYYFFIKFGSTGLNQGAGDYRVSLPVTSTAPLGSTLHNTTGTLLMADASSGGFRTGTCFVPGSSLSVVSMIGDGGVNIIGAGAPWAWATGDYLSGMITYPVQN